MRCLKVDRRGAAAFERFGPARDANAPAIAGLEPGETPLRMRCDQVVSIEHGEIEKFARDLDANRVQTAIFGTGAAITIAIKSRDGIATAAF